MFWRLPLLALILAYGSASPQQTAAHPEHGCIVSGTVSDASNGEPLRKTTVTLARGAKAYVFITDTAGNFHFDGIPAGDYDLSAQRGGYLETSLGAQEPGSGAVLSLKANDNVSGLVLKLARFSTMSGKIEDEIGEPVRGASVTAISQSWVHGRLRYSIAMKNTSDDNGEYRFGSLRSGSYRLYVSSEEVFVDEQGGTEKRLRPVFYPDSQTFETALPIELHASEDLTGLDFQLHTVDAFHVRGKAIPGGVSQPLREVSVGLSPGLLQWSLNSGILGKVEADGTFDIRRVPSGFYTLHVFNGSFHHQVASAPIEVKGKDVNGLAVPLLGLVKLQGLVHEPPNTSGVPDVSGVAITITAADGDPAYPFFAAVQRTGRFETGDLPAGKYVIHVRVSDPSEYVKSIVYGRQEILGGPADFSGGSTDRIEVFLSKGAGHVDGTLDSSQPEQSGMDLKAPAPDIVLFSPHSPVEQARVLFARPDQNGHFSFLGLAPGTYYALAAPAIEKGIWENPDFLSQLQSKAVEVDVGENSKLQIKAPVLDLGDLERAKSTLPQ